MRCLVMIGVLAGALGFSDAAAARPDQAPLRAAAAVSASGDAATSYAQVTDALLAAVDAWTASGDDRPTGEMQRLALEQQLIVRRLVGDRAALRRVLDRVPGRQRRNLRDDVLAQRELASIHSVTIQKPKVRLGPALPPARLRAHYRRAWRRFGVGWPLLAAVNHVESAFGRLRNESVSGARGPMQFMPATWAAYGLGGDVRNPRDAILGAANYLHANGAPRDEARALYHYNPSRLYVSAVRRYTRMIRSDQRQFIVLYSRAVFYRGRLRTGPRA